VNISEDTNGRTMMKVHLRRTMMNNDESSFAKNNNEDINEYTNVFNYSIPIIFRRMDSMLYPSAIFSAFTPIALTAFPMSKLHIKV